MKHGITLAVIGCIIFFSSMEGRGAKWEPFADTVGFTASYDSENLTHTQDIIRVWVKYVFTEKGIINEVGKRGKEYADLDFRIYLKEINCVDKTTPALSNIDYSKDGTIISSRTEKVNEWDFIIPETLNDILHKKICKQPKK